MEIRLISLDMSDNWNMTRQRGRRSWFTENFAKGEGGGCNFHRQDVTSQVPETFIKERICP